MPALLALVVVMFSLERRRPAPHASDLAPDAFSGADAFADTARLAQRFPDRRPGSPGDAGLGGLSSRRASARSASRRRAQRFFTDVDGEDAELSNVIGRLRGRSDRAGRDPGPPRLRRPARGRVGLGHRRAARAGPGAGRARPHEDDRARVHRRRDGRRCRCAALRRALRGPAQGRRRAGARRHRRAASAPAVRGAVVDGLEPRRRRSPRGRSKRALRARPASAAGSESWLGQFVRLAWPLTLREQGPLVRSRHRRGDAHRRAASCRAAPAPDTIDRRLGGPPDALRAGGVRGVLAFDSPALRGKPTAPLYRHRAATCFPAWSLALLAVGLMLPALVAAVDAVARARRRRGAGGGLDALGARRGDGRSRITSLRRASRSSWSAGCRHRSRRRWRRPPRPSFGEAVGPLLAALALLLALAWVTRAAPVRRASAHLRDPRRRARRRSR